MEPEIITFIGNYGVVGLILYFFIKEFFSYLNKNKVAETLKDANKDRKADTDEVAKNLNSEQNICLAEIKKDIEFIKTQVSNHIPTSLKELNDKLDKQTDKLERHIESQNLFEKDILVKIAKI